uniref:Uncharacterized protein n=1 Tax=Meloidogyne enterolobii TaxID=390850 RepID=A0A6V7V1K4_MELEN|nr:unnamed protein product [Meloidogyne enterolobii]
MVPWSLDLKPSIKHPFPCVGCKDWCKNKEGYSCKYTCETSFYPLCTHDYVPIDRDGDILCDIIKNCTYSLQNSWTWWVKTPGHVDATKNTHSIRIVGYPN